MEEKRKDPKEKKCAICGKDIYAGEEWAYKRREKSERTKWFCSYKCMRAYDAKHGSKQVPDIEEMEEQAAEMLNLQGGVNYQLKVDEAMKAEKDMPATPFGIPTAEELAQEIMTRDQVLRIVDEAAMECMDGREEIVWGSNDTIEQTLFRGAKENAVKVGMMKMRSEIRRKLGVEE